MVRPCACRDWNTCCVLCNSWLIFMNFSCTAWNPCAIKHWLQLIQRRLSSLINSTMTKKWLSLVRKMLCSINPKKNVLSKYLNFDTTMRLIHSHQCTPNFQNMQKVPKIGHKQTGNMKMGAKRKIFLLICVLYTNNFNESHFSPFKIPFVKLHGV